MKNQGVCIILMMLVISTTAHCQGTFQNLGFEAAEVPDLPEGAGEVVNISDGLPDWSAAVNDQQITQIYHNGQSFGGPIPSILGPNFDPAYIIDGQYTVFLRSGAISPDSDLSLYQIGVVPSNARSLLFKIATGVELAIGNPIVSLGGIPLNQALLQTGANYALYGVDISAFVGQTEELRFTAAATPAHFTGFYLDSIQFSAQAIPEPVPITLLFSALALIGGFQWFKNQRKA